LQSFPPIWMAPCFLFLLVCGWATRDFSSPLPPPRGDKTVPSPLFLPPFAFLSTNEVLFFSPLLSIARLFNNFVFQIGSRSLCDPPPPFALFFTGWEEHLGSTPFFPSSSGTPQSRAFSLFLPFLWKKHIRNFRSWCEEPAVSHLLPFFGKRTSFLFFFPPFSFFRTGEIYSFSPPMV